MTMPTTYATDAADSAATLRNRQLRAECPVCRMVIALRTDGTMTAHGTTTHGRCYGTGRRPDETAAALSGNTNGQTKIARLELEHARALVRYWTARLSTDGTADGLPVAYHARAVAALRHEIAAVS